MQNDKKEKQRLLVICGPTATGKSALAVELARRFNGEIISADSRQVYRGLNIGTGKVTRREMRGVPHYLLDVADPGKRGKTGRFTVDDFKRLAQAKIADIAWRGKLPILCGGSGFYIQAVVDNVELPNVPPDLKLRARLEKIASVKAGAKGMGGAEDRAEKLFAMLKRLDPKRAKTIDRRNPRRLIRAIEIATALGTVPPAQSLKAKNLYRPIFIGLRLPDDTLKKKIHARLLARLKRGMIAEVRRLHAGEPMQMKKNDNGAAGLSWKRLHELGLEYRYIALHLQKKPPCVARADLIDKLSTKIWRYARRQKTWFKKDPRITWFNPAFNPATDKKKIEKFVSRQLGKK